MNGPPHSGSGKMPPQEQQFQSFTRFPPPTLQQRYFPPPVPHLNMSIPSSQTSFPSPNITHRGIPPSSIPTGAIPPSHISPRAIPSHSILHRTIPPPPIPPRGIPPPPIPPRGIPPPPIPHGVITKGVIHPPSVPPPLPSFSPQVSTKHYPPGHASSVVSLNSRDRCSAQDEVDQIVKRKRFPEIVETRTNKNDIQVHVYKEKISTAFELIKDLENGARTLCVMMKSVSSSEWENKCEEIEETKKKLAHLLEEINLTEDDIKVLKEKYSKRMKKRARLRRRAGRVKKQREDEKVKIQSLHFQIDNWQREMQEGVERIQREEELKKEADAVLWGVNHKKMETKRQIAMLSALLTLRSVRVGRLTAAGKSVPQSQIETFNTVIERLRKMWMQHLDECLLEEQALRGMLGNSTTDDDPVKTYKKLILNEWEIAMFGSVGTLDSTLKTDSLIQIRHDWDQFALKEPSILASSIPPGFVLPVPPSSDDWRKFLKQN